MHSTLEKVLIKWMKTISKTFKNDKFSKYDMKPDRPPNKKDKKKSRKRIKPYTKLVIKTVIKKDTKKDTELNIKPVIKKDIKPVIKKDTNPDIKKDTNPDIKKDTKPDIKKDTKPDIKIGKKHHQKCLKLLNSNLKIKVIRKKKVITWVFWKSHVTEICEKRICCRNNYAYARSEEFRTFSGEVFFTNEHKAVFSKNKAKTYIDINDLEIFKDFSKDNKTKFKKKPKTKIDNYN